MQNSSQLEDLPLEIIDIIKSFLTWKEQLKINLCRREKFKESFLVGRNQHKEALLYAIQKVNVKLVKDILLHSRRDQLPRDFPFGDDFRDLIFNERIKIDERVEHLELVEILLLSDERIDPSDEDNLAIKYACFYGHYDAVKLLLSDERIDPSAEDNLAIKCACFNGQSDVVKLLLSDIRVHPSAEDNLAVKYASLNGHFDVVKLLLSDERVDPSAEDNLAIKYASLNGHFDVVKLLLSDDRVEPM